MRPPPVGRRSPTRSSAPQPRIQHAPQAPPGASKRFLIMSSIAIYGLSAYGFYLYRSYQTTASQSRDLDVPHDVSGRYDDTASTFDRDVEVTEWLMGMGWLRKRLVRKAAGGDVLEVSAGTGRNLRFYRLEKLGRLTLVDRSRPMLERARDKFILLRTSGVFPKDAHTKVHFLVQDAMNPILLPPSSSSSSSVAPATPAKGFDTVIQTMGLCSTPEPVQLLKHLGSLADQERGQILLLEHGRSHYAWLNEILDSLAKAHALKHGCWWNRDIGRIVEESGLEVVQVKRYHLGTTWWVELRPRPRPGPGLRGIEVLGGWKRIEFNCGFHPAVPVDWIGAEQEQERSC